MKSISRRDLNHSLAHVLDQVMSTGEPVEVTTRGGRPLVISLKDESVYERWSRQGLVTGEATTVDRLRSIGGIDTSSTAEEILDDVRSDH